MAEKKIVLPLFDIGFDAERFLIGAFMLCDTNPG